jgi:hypothetical protein
MILAIELFVGLLYHGEEDPPSVPMTLQTTSTRLNSTQVPLLGDRETYTTFGRLVDLKCQIEGSPLFIPIIAYTLSSTKLEIRAK